MYVPSVRLEPSKSTENDVDAPGATDPFPPVTDAHVSPGRMRTALSAAAYGVLKATCVPIVPVAFSTPIVAERLTALTCRY